MERSTTQRVSTRVRALPPASPSPGAAAVRPGPLSQWLTVVAGVGQIEAELFKSLVSQVLQGCFAACAVIFVGWADVRGQQPAALIDEELAFTALDFLVPVEAFGRHASLAEFDGLGV